MICVGRHTGPAVETTRREMTLYAVGVAASIGVWIALVTFAIKLGGAARGGTSAAWLLMIVACLGAIACLVLALLLGVRVWELRTGVRAPRSSGGGRRIQR